MPGMVTRCACGHASSVLALVVGQPAVALLGVNDPRRNAGLAQPLGGTFVADAATARIRAAPCLMCRGTFLRKSSRNSPWRSADTGMRLTIEAAPLARTAAGRPPSTLPSRTIARKNAGSSLVDRLMPSRTTGPVKAARGDHLERDGRTHAEPDHDVRADLRRQLGREPRVVLDAVVVRRRRAGMAGQRRGNQPHALRGPALPSPRHTNPRCTCRREAATRCARHRVDLPREAPSQRPHSTPSDEPPGHPGTPDRSSVTPPPSTDASPTGARPVSTNDSSRRARWARIAMLGLSRVSRAKNFSQGSAPFGYVRPEMCAQARGTIQTGEFT